MRKNIEINHVSSVPFEEVLIRHFSTEVQLRPEFVFFFLLEGNMQLSIYEKTVTLHTHDIAFLMPYEVHSVQNTSHDIHVLALFIYPEYLKTFCPDITEIGFETHHLRYSENDSTCAALCTSLADIITNTIKKDSVSRLKLMSAISFILIQLIDTFGSRRLDPPENTDYIKQRIALLLDYLNENYAEKITLASAANVLGFHPQYFSAFFKRHFHTTFLEYLTTLRVNKTLPLLANTDMSITDIALNHGFSNHKTYSSAFGRLHGMTPSAYRKERALANKNTQLSTQNLDYFSFFQRYWRPDSQSRQTDRALKNHLTLRFYNLVKKDTNRPFPECCFSVGRASAILRNDIQSQIRAAKEELAIHTLRIRDIFSDDLFVYYEDEEHRPVINWKYIDIIFDFLLSLNIRPFPEIGFMPRALASKKQFAGWIYQPNVSIPKSFKKWTLLVSDFISHLLSRYGTEEVEGWNFDFWTAPNLNIRDGYWNESKEDFFLFYRITYHAIKNLNKNIRIGSPNFSIPSGLDWYRDFCDYCREYELKPAYISSHLYNCSDEISPTAGDFSRFSNSWDNVSITNTTRDTALNNIHTLEDLLQEKHFENLQIIVSDWNLSFIPRDLVRDTCFMAPYILYTCIMTRGIISTLCFRSLSDINEDFFIDQKPFHGGPGLMDFNGLKKASYYAFALLKKMGPEFIDSGENYLLTHSPKGYQLLLFHYVYYDSLYTLDDHSSLSYKQRYNIYESSEGLVIHSILPLLKGSYRIRETRIDRSSGSAYDLWLQTGAWQEVDGDLIDYIQKKGIPDVCYSIRECDGSLLLDTEIAPHGVVLLEIEPEK